VSDDRQPGWYADPSGDPDRLRWWDGSAWTGIDRARMPHEQAMPVAPPAGGGPGDLLDSEARPLPGLPWRWIAVLLAVTVLGGLVLTGRLPGLSGGLGDRTLTSQAPPSVGGPTSPPPTTPRPVTGRLVDGTARLSYDVLPGRWQSWDRDSFEGLVTTSGYYRVVQQETPEGGPYWANVTSGPVSPSLLGITLQASARRLASTLDAAYYPAHTRRGTVERAVTVDGHNAFLIRWLTVFDSTQTGGYLAKSEVVAVLVVDIGRDVPSALYLSLPDPVRSAWPSVDALLDSVRVLP
jgi:Protein of unknown function (DUF2510)